MAAHMWHHHYPPSTMPIDKKEYPANWPAISLQVRNEAGWKCEWCHVPNRAVIERIGNGTEWREIIVVWDTRTGTHLDTSSMNANQLREHNLRKIVLTVAHLDRDSHNNARDNLAALCQKCHLGHDKGQHSASRKYGKKHRQQPTLL